jgi:hypothetical protein
MTAVYAITSNDTLTLNGNVFSDQSTGDVSKITFPNDIVTIKVGKDGNAIFAQNAQGNLAKMELRVIRGSSDDVFMQGLLAAQTSSFPAATLLAGTFVKMLGQGAGTVISDTYTLNGGAITKFVEGKENVDGDVSQAESVYMITFAAAVRTIS